MLKNNIYNIDEEFDYSTIKAAVLKSLEKIVKEGALKNTSHFINEVISYPEDTADPTSINNQPALTSPSLLKLKIRNTTKYLTWRIAVLNRDNFRCKELWNLSNGVSICYSCHKDIEKLRTKLRNILYG
jgi:hypothetical protein